MADEADITGDRLDAEIEFARRQLARSVKRELIPLHMCYNCDEKFEITDKRLFCDADCRTDWERFNVNHRG